jgi:GntR family transcriptional regulator
MTQRPVSLGQESTSSKQRSARRVYNLLRAAIRSGAVEQRDLFVEHHLMRTLGSSRNSVREALQMLADDGLVRREPRIGTMLTGKMMEVPVHGGIGDNAHPSELGSYAVTKLDERIITSPYLARRIEADNDRLTVVEYIVSMHDAPISVLTIYVEADKASDSPYFDDLDDRTGSFVRRFGREVGSVESSIEAVICEPRTGGLLQLPDRSAVLLRETIIRDCDGRARELSYTHYRADRVALTFAETFDRPTET